MKIKPKIHLLDQTTLKILDQHTKKGSENKMHNIQTATFEI